MPTRPGFAGREEVLILYLVLFSVCRGAENRRPATDEGSGRAVDECPALRVVHDSVGRDTDRNCAARRRCGGR
jgi:hypothetical protein